jgi:amidohydrolase
VLSFFFREVTIMPELRADVSALAGWLKETRRDFHRHPELGYEEKRTAGIIAACLEKLGLEVRTGLGKTGVVGLWRSRRPGPCLGLRADMDALPIHESPGAPWCSTRTGLMHACGHDFHTTMLLGTARVIIENETVSAKLNGDIQFIFQPAEEGGAGALAMIEDGALSDPVPDAIFAAHVDPANETGTVLFTPHVAMASTDNFHFTIKGRGGHAAHPELSLDPIIPPTLLINRLKAAATEFEKTLAAVCTFQAGSRVNIIPETAEIGGTVRCLLPESRERIRTRIDEIVAALEQETGVRITACWETGYPMLINNSDMLALVTRTASAFIGADNVIEIPPTYGAEDMAYFLEKIPGAFYFLGCRHAGRREFAGLHSPEFDPDESALTLGVEMMIRLAENFLASR